MGVKSLNERVRSGEREAFAEIFDQHARVVHAYAARSTGDWTAAEDVMSLTFLEAWRLRHKLRDEVVSVRPWLLGIATNVLRNSARAARRHRKAMARLETEVVHPDFSDAVVGQLADSQRLEAASRALLRLKRSEREVFTLVVWSGLSYPAAAEALGVPTGTVRSRLSRARVKLRQMVEAELGSAVSTPQSERVGGHSVKNTALEVSAHRRKA
ncbi:RNA polymerase sigma factor [[Kitasatospora] papulosa]|uniref:RNA polymerase sigma factor n=1 Tax=Streptomyces TaxID=1883 RepID=UPI001689A47E|nr:MULTISPECIES: RNA polymerase sigma factor [Streptomyces]MBD2835134.1 RNA polymerase sigma factor [Streptomyces pratensis]MCX4417847.1 RNA polymerase sigma factor [[Kitasatospora] papulosa]MCY1649346.1 RNA polymerase sigma factor [Streptomyces sp. SL203]MCY1677058.1 RNA polymerase sigma factor [Streptomyces sp. SL294]